MKEQLEKIRQEALGALESVKDAGELDALRVRFLGKKGELTGVLKTMGKLSAEERPVMGQAANNVRAAIEEKIESVRAELKEKAMEARLEAEAIDVTIPGTPVQLGHRHPMNKALDEAKDIFISMGFKILDGPEVELADYNFTKLNIAENHPSRDRSDTFYVTDDEEVLLRTQTSPVQIRTMESHEPPVRIVAPGRVFRRDTPDATHGMNFHQIEGLYIDRNVSMADLKSVLRTFATEMYGPKVKIRLRPHFFPFTEPSVEYDFSCIMCGGKGCPVCKNSGWIEIAGAGMVDPNVLKNVGYDPEIWSGYAFGLGIERLAMLRYRIPDLRYLYENDVRFLEQF